MSYVPPDLTTDVDTMYQQAVERFQLTYPDWEPDETTIIAILLSSAADMSYEQAYIMAQQFDNIYSDFGEELYGIPANEATSAIGSTTWIASDTLGHTIPAGEPILIDGIGFTVDTTVTIPAGTSSTSVGEVTVTAIDPGIDANDLGALIEPVNALEGWVESIQMVGITSGGTDPETNDDYRDRLADELTTVSPTAVTASDFVKFARRVPGAHRAIALDAYHVGGTNTLDPATNTYGNPGYITMSVIDEDGDVGPIADVLTDLNARRMTGIIVETLDPTYNIVDVVGQIAIDSVHYVTADVVSDVTLAIQEYLNPARWGLDPYADNDRDWDLEKYIRRDELLTIVNNIPGVKYVVDGTLAVVTNNLLTDNQSSLETNTTGWAAGTSTGIARSLAQAYVGVASLAITRNTTTGNAVAATTDIPVTTGNSYRGRARFRAATTPRSCQVTIGWYTAGASFISETIGTAVSDTTSGWTLAEVTGTAPATAALARLNVVAQSAVATEVHYADDMALKNSSTVGNVLMTGVVPLPRAGLIEITAA